MVWGCFASGPGRFMLGKTSIIAELRLFCEEKWAKIPPSDVKEPYQRFDSSSKGALSSY